MKKIIIFSLKGIMAFLLLLIIASIVILLLNIRVELSFLNKPVELAIEKIIDRDFSMQGEVVLIPTLWPTLEIHDVSIANPESGSIKSKWGENEFAHFGQLRLQLGLAPLLAGEIHIADVLAEKITLNLENDANGEPNWIFDLPDKEPHSQIKEPANEPEKIFHFEAIDSIVLRDISVNYDDHSINKHLNFSLQTLKGEAQVNRDIKLEFNGRFQDKSFSADLKGGGLDIFRDEQKKWPLNMNMIVAGTNIDLSGDLLKGKDPQLAATLEIGKTDIGATLSWLKIIDGLDVLSEKLTMTTKLKGNSLSEILTHSELSIILKNAQWIITEKNTGGALPVKISKGTIKIEPDKAVAVHLDGLLAQSKVNIAITGAPAIDYTRENIKTPVKLSLQTHNTNLLLTSEISNAMNVSNMGFNLVFKGNKLSDLNTLLRMDLPPLGPYRLQGYFAVNNKGYQIKNILLKVKDSRLKGDFSLDAQAKPPHIKIDLLSKQIQINNFDVGEWSPVAKDDDKKNETKDKPVKMDAARKENVSKLLSHETLSRFNADIKLKVDQVLSGKDTLGNGLVTIKQNNARFDLNLEELTLPGGDAQARFSYYPTGNKQIETSLDVKVKNFNYGILARRIDEQSDVAGQLSLDVELSAKNVNNIDSLLTQSQGHIDFAWAPEALDAALFEMWAVNLMTSLLENTDKEKSSKVNCVIGRFVLDQGMMKDKVIFVDSSKMRMMGTAEANFQDRSIKVRLTPRAKRPEFFSLATPVGLTGTFDNFNISLNPVGLTTTAISFISSPLHVPVRRLFNKGLPEDGYEACKAMWDASDEIDDKAEK